MKKPPRLPSRVINSSCSVFCSLCNSTMTRKHFLFGKRSCDNLECDSLLTKQIESSQKGIDYVDSLAAKNNDVIGAVMEQVKNSQYSPNYVKYHDGEKWVEVWGKNPQSAETVF